MLALLFDELFVYSFAAVSGTRVFTTFAFFLPADDSASLRRRAGGCRSGWPDCFWPTDSATSYLVLGLPAVVGSGRLFVVPSEPRRYVNSVMQFSQHRTRLPLLPRPSMKAGVRGDSTKDRRWLATDLRCRCRRRRAGRCAASAVKILTRTTEGSSTGPVAFVSAKKASWPTVATKSSASTADRRQVHRRVRRPPQPGWLRALVGVIALMCGLAVLGRARVRTRCKSDMG